MTVFETITNDMKTAMKAKDKITLTATRGLFAAIKAAAIDEGQRENISDDIALKVIKKQAKQRKDSIEQYTKADRVDLAEQEQAELTIIETYLPEMLSKADVQRIVDEVKASTGATEPKQFGMLMGATMKALAGQEVDGALVKSVVQASLEA
jgi:uncharacterized protein YqeY